MENGTDKVWARAIDLATGGGFYSIESVERVLEQNPFRLYRFDIRMMRSS
jgi:hypothetical protein